MSPARTPVRPVARQIAGRRSRPTHRALCFFLFAPLWPLAYAQEPPANPTPQDQPYTLTLSARLVPLDVVIVDKKGHAVHGLKQSDFHIKEDGIDQPIKSFEEHGVAAPRVTTLPPMPPGYHTNFPEAAVTESVTVLLLDSLNTRLSDQAFVHQQILQFLKTVPPGNRVAIFTLASKLRLLQGFTTDPAVLTAVLKSHKSLPKSSMLAGDAELGSNTRAELNIDDPSLGVASSLSDFDSDFLTFQDQQRNLITQQALRDLGEFLSGVPGRKNLVWFAGNFPIGLSATPTGADPLPLDLTQQAADRRELIDLYVRNRIAVYPVSASGLEVNSFTSASQSNRSLATNSTAITDASINAANQRANERIPMEKLAEDTGGRAFFDTNGLKQAIDTAVNDGNNYYSLSYVPAEHDFDKRFHQITVTVDGPYKLSYRRGYYSDGPTGIQASLPEGLRPGFTLQDAMMRGVPDATAIIFKVRVAPVPKPPDAKPLGDTADKLKPPTVRYAIDYASSMRAMTITQTPDGLHHAAVNVAAVVYDLDGNPLNYSTNELKLDLKPQAFADFVRSGMKFTQEIDLPSSPVFLKLGIADPANGNIGTMEIPLDPRKDKLPAAPPATATPQAPAH